MSNTDRIQKINEALQHIRISNRSGSHVNCLRIQNNCSVVHNDKIIELAKEFLRNHIPFVTEAIFKNNSRCDILLPATFEIIEILHSETDERFSKKIKNYPDVFTIRKVRI